MANPTTNLSMTKPTVGGSTDTWGTTLNEEVVDVIDAVFSISGTDVTMSDIKFNSVGLQETGAGTDTVKFQAPAAVTQYTLTMPGAVGASGQILRTSVASGTREWVTEEEGDLKSVADATNGGLDVTNGTGPDVTLGVDFNDLAAAVVDVAADWIGILDATDNNTKKETIADLVSAMGGTGLTGASGQLGVDASQTQVTAVGTLVTGVWNAGALTTSGDVTLSATNKVNLSATTYARESATNVLMLSTASTDRWKVTADGHLLTEGDNNYDIGGSGANRPRNVYVAGTITAGGTITGDLVGDVTGNVSGTAATVTSATQAAITTAANLVTVGALDSGSITSGFGTINTGSSAITGGAGSFTTISGSTSLALATGATVTGIDNGSLGSSATLLATQGAIKTYVDAQVGTVDTLAEVLANGNTTGSTNIIVSASQKITTDTIDETTAAAGVTIDSVLVKDNTVTATTFTGALTGNVTGNASGTSATVTGATQAAITSAANLATVGTLGSGAISSGFGNIDVGSSSIDGGTITAATALAGTLSTAAQTNITSVGTLASLNVTSDLNVDSGTLFVDASEDTVCMGTTTAKANQKLHVVGNEGEGTIAAPNQSVALFQRNVNSGNSCYVTIAAGTASEAGLLFADSDASESAGVKYNNSTDSMIFRVNASNAMTIDSGGDVSIGAGDLDLAATQKLYLDGGNNTYIIEPSADRIELVAGNNTAAKFGVGTANSLGGGTSGWAGLKVATTFTSDGSDSVAHGAYFSGAITGAAGDTSYMSGTFFDNQIITQTATESIGLISQVRIAEPNITDNLTGDITTACSLYVHAAPTEGEDNYALYVKDGTTRLDGDLSIAATQKLYLDGGSNTFLWESGTDTISFATGGTDRWKIDDAGNLRSIADGIYDIGGDTSERPRGVYAKNFLGLGDNAAAAGEIRLKKDFKIATRSNANDADKVVISENVVTGNDTMDIGDNTKWSAIRFHVSTANVMELTSSAINLNKAVTANNATIKLTGLLDADPQVAGQLWNDSGTVKISAG